jgi:hypothetical protein
MFCILCYFTKAPQGFHIKSEQFSKEDEKPYLLQSILYKCCSSSLYWNILLAVRQTINKSNEINQPSTHQAMPAPTTETPTKYPSNQLTNKQTEHQASTSAFF